MACKQGCGRSSWDVKPDSTCCRQCQHSGGQIHGPECQRSNGYCVVGRCSRPPAVGYVTCCRTCQATGGTNHGPTCKPAAAAAAAARAAEAAAAPAAAGLIGEPQISEVDALIAVRNAVMGP